MLKAKVRLMNKAAFIRPATAEDIKYIADEESAVFRDPWSEASITSLIGDSYHTVLIAELEGSAAGYAIVSAIAGEGELLRVAASPCHRRAGIGGALLDEAIAGRKADGDEVMFLEVRASNVPAISLYTSRGFEVYATRRNYYKNPTEDAVMMRLVLCK